MDGSDFDNIPAQPYDPPAAYYRGHGAADNDDVDDGDVEGGGDDVGGDVEYAEDGDGDVAAPPRYSEAVGRGGSARGGRYPQQQQQHQRGRRARGQAQERGERLLSGGDGWHYVVANGGAAAARHRRRGHRNGDVDVDDDVDGGAGSLPLGYTPDVGDVRVRWRVLRGPLALSVMGRQLPPAAGLRAMHRQFMAVIGLQPPQAPPALLAPLAGASPAASAPAAASAAALALNPGPVAINPSALPHVARDPDLGLLSSQSSHSAAEMLRRQEDLARVLTWILRFLGGGAVIAGVNWVLSPAVVGE